MKNFELLTFNRIKRKNCIYTTCTYNTLTRITKNNSSEKN